MMRMQRKLCILTGGFEMNKDDILKKARAEKQDGVETQAKDQSFKWIYSTMALFAVVFACIRAFRGQPVTDLCATVCASVGVGMMYRYFRTKDRSCLWLGIVLAVCAVAATVRFFMGY